MAKGFDVTLDVTSGTLGRNIEHLPDKIDGYIHAVMVYQSAKAKTYMQTEASWIDRTGNARNGLSANTGWKPKKSHTITLFHRMPYGIFLETRWAGRYAIILPTIQKFGPDTMRLLEKMFRNLGNR